MNASPPVEIPPSMAEKFADADWGANHLEQITIVKKFSRQELKDIYQRGTIQALKAGTHAVIEGEPSRGVYIILHGSVSVYKNDSVTGAMHRLAYLEEGATFGEISLFDNAPRSATVAADTHCYVFCLDAETFEEYLTSAGDDARIRFYKTCAEEMSERFRSINSDYIISQQLLWKYALRRTDEDQDPVAG